MVSYTGVYNEHLVAPYDITRRDTEIKLLIVYM